MSMRTILMGILCVGLAAMILGLLQRTSEIQRGSHVYALGSSGPSSPSDNASCVRLHREMFPVGPFTAALLFVGLLTSIGAIAGLLVCQQSKKKFGGT
jgi:hypothetical protein